MCLAIPAQIVEMGETRAKVALAGNEREADLSLSEDAAVGDWVLIHAGFAIEKLSSEEAAESLKLFSEMDGLGGMLSE